MSAAEAHVQSSMEADLGQMCQLGSRYLLEVGTAYRFAAQRAVASLQLVASVEVKEWEVFDDLPGFVVYRISEVR